MGAIVWLASYPKSGNTWLRAFLHNLLRNPDKPIAPNEFNRFSVGAALKGVYRAVTDQDVDALSLEEITALRLKAQRFLTTASPDSVFVKTHSILGDIDGVPSHAMDVTAGAIYVVRNPLDVVLSMVPHYGLPLDQAVAMINNPSAFTGPDQANVREVIGSWGLNVDSWTAKESETLHVVRYEDMLEKPNKTFLAIARFLGFDPPRDRLERAIRFSSFKVLKNLEENQGFVERSPTAERFFREGKSGQWRKTLSPDQVEIIVSGNRPLMEKFGYIPKGF